MFNLIPSKTFGRKVINILLTLAFIILWIEFSIGLFNRLRPKTMEDILDFVSQKPKFTFSWFIFTYSVFWAPLWEELVFRWAPLNIAKKAGPQYVLPIMFISSAIFGYGHGYGAISISQQGIAGFALCWLHIKNNYSYISTFIVHFLWNLTVLILIPWLN